MRLPLIDRFWPSVVYRLTGRIPWDRLPGADFGPDGRFRIVSVIGSGGSGRVFRAVDSHDNTTIALKMVRGDARRGTLNQNRVCREANIFGRLSHENIAVARSMGWDVVLGRILVIYTESEFIPGYDLEQLLRSSRGSLDLSLVARIALQVCCALEYVHAEGVIHRDLKPTNIMIRVDPNDGSQVVKIIDFGIARHLEQHSGLTRPGEWVGSPGYSAPEQLRGESIDERADVFSFGAVLYELITGRHAFDGSSAREINRAVRASRMRPIRDVRAGVPPQVEQLVEKMLDPDREKRPSLEEVRSCLQTSLLRP